ncbi:MAG: ion channel [Acinetobacter junii]|uniref:ion channel n=1 Tax=Acinetobacter sp. GWC1_38_13 TaxID=1797234 RepID=UPI0008C998C6|nr:ion channel [Acinetobacter sp. GWC1_38_13]OFW46602.1 MAG: ion channel [Acinetobacter sp. GWC1_38_13]
MQTIKQFWNGFRLLPSAWLLLVQLALLILATITYDDSAYRALTWSLGVLALLIIAKVIRQTPVFAFWGLFFVSGAFIFSILIFVGFDNHTIQITAYSFEALAYFYAAYGLLKYMFSDRYLTKDELFAAGAVFTLIAWAFAFLYSICQIILPNSFQNPNHPEALQRWLDLLFLSFSLQSATGLSDLMPLSPAARVLTMLQMFGGVMYFAVIVSRLIALQYIPHAPKNSQD